MKRKKAAHFLLIPELLHSPPNEAIINAYINNGYAIDIYTPGRLPESTRYGQSIRVFRVEYTWLWLGKNLLSFRWLQYDVVSGTSEDPLCIVGLISDLYRKKSICLVDEIKSGTYRGDRSESWKSLCKHAIIKSHLQIVNDESRINLLREYASLDTIKGVIVYPGCFYNRPIRNEQLRHNYRTSWGFCMEDFIIGSSGGFNLTAGADWLLKYVGEDKEVKSVIQPLGVSPLSMFLLKSLECSNRIYIQDKRMDWNEAWESAQALDIGICIYMNQAPQFQNMGISSNRLCMFLAMGVPVIASKQDSFQFLEDYGCGVMVEDYNEFKDAVGYIKNNKSVMMENCEKCFHDYITPSARYQILAERIKDLKSR